MTDYSKLKVVDLKAELKQRGLPQTGLKQALIDRLVEDDANSQSAAADETPQEAEATPVLDQPAPQEQPEPEAQEAAGGKPEISVNKEETEIPQKEQEEQVTGISKQEAQPAPETNGHPTSPTGADVSSESRGGDEAQTETAQLPVEAPPSSVPEQATEATRSEDSQLPEVAQKPEPEVVPASVDKTGDASSAGQTVAPTPTSVTAEETQEDNRKRKRRSHSPLPLPSETAQKRAKQEDHGGEVQFHEDEESENKDQRAQKEGIPITPEEHEEAKSQEELPQRTAGGDEAVSASEKEQEKPERREESPHARASPPARGAGTGDRRLKDLFSESLKDSTRDKSPSRQAGPSTTLEEEAEEEEEEGRTVGPALHPATSALYVRDFMRPLQPHTLKAHLISLATPPNSSPDSEILRTFFLDPIRTHCFASFSNVSAASRVRSALHGRVWPDERTRKPLWADFVPEEKMGQWIEMEQSSSGGGRPSAAKRWEVVYEPAENDGDMIEAVLREAGAGSWRPEAGAGAGRGVQGAPEGPRRSEADLYDRRRPSDQASRRPSKPANAGFMALDTLFKSTSTKPKIYYLPVSKDLSEKRLDELADRLGGPGRNLSRGEDEMRRYTFEDGDLLVDRGLDVNPGRRGGPSYRRGNSYGRRGGWR
ncbi:hypothetical protein L228DRAFT_247215 [Xylona heveae TC161]|uniref:SAP domain-containing protein n=1 Tax=Xylona heveae (strain CBS 132557 / TC161) TaxID=1328760 RepID=A0A165H052_XYLHT|nr:hypothetical protein L228DRAFT_247215 [Xylona heveae TC161]KZF22820.1 hypothetical protein L228DRAFT_247215 [Xylona heveae TC161]